MAPGKGKRRSLAVMAIICLLVGIGVPLLNLVYVYPRFVENTVADVEDDATQISRLLSRVLLSDQNWEDWLSQGMVPDYLRDEFRQVVGDVDLHKLKLFLADGRTIYSTDVEDVGKRNTHDYFHRQVASGHTFAKLVRHQHSSLEGQKYRQDVVEVYVPIVRQGQFLGAFEFYIDVSERMAALRSLLLRLSILPTSVLLLAMVFLLWQTRRIDDYIQGKLAAEENLEKALDESWRVVEEMGENQRQLAEQAEKLEKLNRQLKAAQSQMLQQEKMASIGQLAAGVAHEINNPVGFVNANLGTLGKYFERLLTFRSKVRQLLEKPGDGEGLDRLKLLERELKLNAVCEDIPDLIAESRQGMERVKEIVQNLKSFSRVDSNGWQQADLNECLEATLKVIWNELKYKAKVTKDYGELPRTFCRAQELNQVFMNLLVNAAHAIEKEGVITIVTRAREQDISVAISDTGCGIPEDVRTRIFEPFFTTKEVGKGTGLGLSISWDIVRRHGGRIEVDSKPGEGTTFTVILPIRSEPPVQEDGITEQRAAIEPGSTHEDSAWESLNVTMAG
ncbi:MAG: hypothetical protein Tsb0017_21110 [Geothermobacteraceae bacterium]